MTNATKTVGGAIASAVFAIALASTGSLEDPAEGHAPLRGYLTVWAVCAVAALLAAVRAARHAAPADVAPQSAASRPTSARPAARYLGASESEDMARDERARTSDGRTPVESDRTPGPAEGRRRAPGSPQQHTWVDLQIRQAMERGDFDDLPGAGKPIEDLGDRARPGLVAQEAGRARADRACCPPSLQLRKEDAELDDRLDRSTSRRRCAARSRTSTSG